MKNIRHFTAAALGLFALALVRPSFAAESAAPVPTAATQAVIVIVGAPGEDTFAPGFKAAAQAWQDACTLAGAHCTILGLDEKNDPEASPTDKERFQAWLKQLTPETSATAWIAYIGHGTATQDGRTASMNFRGPDVTSTELAAWLKPLKRPLVFVHGGSTAGPFLTALAGPNRVVITATQNAREINYARFGERFAAAVASPAADIDQDGQTSVLEAFLTAAGEVEAFYTENNRLLTEHALFDDTGDGRGTPANFFVGTRVVKQPQPTGRGNTTVAAVDNARARVIALVPSATERAMTDAQLAARDQLEAQLEKLRTQKSRLPEADYYTALEAIFRQLAALYVPAAPVSSPVPQIKPESGPTLP